MAQAETQVKGGNELVTGCRLSLRESELCVFPQSGLGWGTWELKIKDPPETGRLDDKRGKGDQHGRVKRPI